MCLIVHRIDPKDHLPDEIIQANLKQNDDGFGIAWRDPKKDNDLVFMKFAPSQAKQFTKQLKKIDKMDVEYVAHFRMGTRGLKNQENAHPYKYVDVEDRGVLVFHNGIINGMIGDSNKSDTGLFVDQVISKMSPQWWLHEGEKWLIEKTIGWSRLLIWPSDGDPVHLDGGNQWQEHGGIWYSTYPSGKSGGAKQTAKSSTAVSASKSVDTEANGAACSYNRFSDDYDQDYAASGPSWWERTTSALNRDAKDRRAKATESKGVVTIASRGEEFDGISWNHCGHTVTPFVDSDLLPDTAASEMSGPCFCIDCDTEGAFYSVGKNVYIEIGHRFNDEDEDDPVESAIIIPDRMPIRMPEMLGSGLPN